MIKNPRLDFTRISKSSSQRIIIRKNKKDIYQNKPDERTIKCIKIISLISSVMSCLLVLLFGRPPVEDSFIMIFTLLATSLLAVFGTVSGWRATLSNFNPRHTLYISMADEVVHHILYCSFLSLSGVTFSVILKFIPTSDNKVTIFQIFESFNWPESILLIISAVFISVIVFIFSKIFCLFTISLTQLLNTYEIFDRKSED